ncbi:MAG: M1 family metallopeptidase [Candidatus Saccharibacteria bacterium]
MRTKFWAVVIVLGVFAGYFVFFNGINDFINTQIKPTFAADEKKDVFPQPKNTVYRMALKLDPVNLTITGHSIIRTKNTSDSILNEIYFTMYPNAMRQAVDTPAPAAAYYGGFDPGWITVSSAVVNGMEVDFLDFGINGMLDLPEYIDPGQAVTIDLKWSAKIPRAAYRYGSKDGAVLLGNFYPVLNIKDKNGWHNACNIQFGDPFYTQSADYKVELSLPANYQAVCTGEISDVKLDGQGGQVIELSAFQARDFAIAALSGFLNDSQDVGGTHIQCYYRPSDALVAKEILGCAAASVQYYNNTFGTYPYSRLLVVQAPMEGFRGMEHSGIVFISDAAFKSNYDARDRAFLVAHEVAHQWWFGMVGNDQINEPWLDEGLASWSADRYLKKVEYRTARYRSPEKGYLDRSLNQISNRQSYYDIAYWSGAAFWNGLEQKLGEPEVLVVLRSYLARYRDKTATTDDLRQVIVDESGQDLKPYLDRWFKAE